MASWSSLVCIGTLLLLSQPAPGQRGEQGVGILSANDDQFRDRFRDLLLRTSPRREMGGWELARQLGPAAVPMLRSMHSAEKANVRRRLVVLIAAVLASESVEENWIFERLAKAQLPECVATCFLVALSPRRHREFPAFWEQLLGRRQEPEPLLRIAALLAAVRVPGAVARADELRADETDPGVIAAAAMAGVPMPDSVLGPFLRKNDPPRFAGLVRRGVLIGSLLRGTSPGSDVVELARQSLPKDGEVTRLAEASALVLGSVGAFDPQNKQRPNWQLLRLLAAEPRSARRLSDWLDPAPQPLDEDQKTLAVEYVMSRSIEQVLEEHAQWSAAESVRRDIAIALAWRVCGEDDPPAVNWDVPSVPEWFFVRWAAGSQAGSAPVIDGDPQLEAAARLAAGERLGRDVGRRLLEESLWRRGSHPGLGLWRAHRQLVCDLLMSGSLPGSKFQISVPQHKRYLPAGLGDENALFEVGVDVFDMLSRPEPPIPEECRLR